MEDNRTELQKKFEEQTPTIKGIKGKEYLQVFCSWLHLQVEKSEGQKLPIHDVSGSFSLDFIKWYSGMEEQKILNAYERYKRESGNDR